MSETPEATVRVLFEERISAIKPLSKCKIERILPVAGDASGRSYFRACLSGGGPPSVMLLLYGAAKGPALSGATRKTQEQAMAELAPFLSRHGIPVPNLFFSDEHAHFHVLEDVGDRALWRFTGPLQDDGSWQIAERLGVEYLSILLLRAIDIIASYQRIPADPRSIAFNRGLAFEDYRREIAEFSDFYAADKGLRSSEREALNRAYDGVCETIASFPRVLVHFDFNAWNIFVDGEGNLRVIDFQDASLGSPARDIISLINDRGMDEILGNSLQQMLLKRFIELLQPSFAFPFVYDVTLLHWDFRVSGRFAKLTNLWKTDRYLAWLPGTLRRLGRTLMRRYHDIHGLEAALEIASRISPEVKEGMENPWGGVTA